MKTAIFMRMLLLVSALAVVCNQSVWSQDAPKPAGTPAAATPAAGEGKEGEPKGDAPAEATPVPKAADAKIAINDILAIKVKEDPQHLDRYVQVDSRGFINFGYVGSVPVEGLTGMELEAKLRTLLEADFLKRATVTVVVNAPIERGGGVVGIGAPPAPVLGTIWVMGQVNAKGQMTIPNQEFTVSKAILQAGVAQFSKLSKTKVVRMKNGKSQEIQVNVFDVIYRGKRELDIPIEKDDWIIVPEGMFPNPS